MSKRYDVIYPRNYERNDGTKNTDWLRVGVAFELPSGDLNVILYAVPAGGNEVPGEIRMMLKPSKLPAHAGKGAPEVSRRRFTPPETPHEPDSEW